MPYDSGLAERLDAICSRSFMSEKRMFGGIVWMLRGNICVGVYKEWLIIRVGHDMAETICNEPHTKPMDFTGKVMKGWVMVAPEAIDDDTHLNRYVELAKDFVVTLPAK